MLEDSYYTLMDTQYCRFRHCCPDVDTEVCTWQCKSCDGINYLMSTSNLPKKYQKHQDLNYDIIELPKTVDYLQQMEGNMVFFVDQGYNAYFYGDIGTGKTSWAVRMLTTYFSKICHTGEHHVAGLFISVPEILRNIKFYMTHKNESFREIIELLPKVNLVVWDEMFQTDPTSFESQWLYSLVNSRILNQKSNIYTSNISPDDLAFKDKRLYSRVCLESDCVEFIGNDARGGKKFSNNFSEESSN